ncbi:hypothetical protein WN51_01279 [Melipona quadrifasciata]|uniref:Uncharacterized protein n=1 Tax=Melipona quadrifasciata TaxID=166423 RepID=A0A0N0BF84_9HYME|nr:hypothetical protein WN51_01279 [Melipona quadrifasciata]
MALWSEVSLTLWKRVDSKEEAKFLARAAHMCACKHFDARFIYERETGITDFSNFKINRDERKFQKGVFEEKDKSVINLDSSQKNVPINLDGTSLNFRRFMDEIFLHVSCNLPLLIAATIYNTLLGVKNRTTLVKAIQQSSSHATVYRNLENETNAQSSTIDSNNTQLKQLYSLEDCCLALDPSKRKIRSTTQRTRLNIETHNVSVRGSNSFLLANRSYSPV